MISADVSRGSRPVITCVDRSSISMKLPGVLRLGGGKPGRTAFSRASPRPSCLGNLSRRAGGRMRRAVRSWCLLWVRGRVSAGRRGGIGVVRPPGLRRAGPSGSDPPRVNGRSVPVQGPAGPLPGPGRRFPATAREGRTGRGPVAAAAELAGEPRAVDAVAGAERDLHPAAGLLDEEQADLDAAQAHREVDQVLGVLRDRAGAQQIVAGDRGVGDPAVRGRSVRSASVSPISLSRPSVFRSKSCR